jgi:regulation of enolase protein 1 (concanavalin A-like superfamily)
MKMLRIHRLLLVAVGLSATVGLAADKGAVSIIEGWGKIVDPDSDCMVRAEGKKVMVKVPGTPHDFAGELGRWNAPRILSTVRGEFIIEVKVSGTFKPVDESTIGGRRSYNGAGLMVVKDDNNHVSLHRGTVYIDDKIRHYANFELRRNAELVISRYEMELTEEDALLRLERRGNKVYGMASQDGVNWKSYDPIEVDFPDELIAGVEVVNSSKEPFSCAFEGLSVYRKAAIEPVKP